MVRIIITSDWHLHSTHPEYHKMNFNYHKVLHILREGDVLILNGDIIDSERIEDWYSVLANLPKETIIVEGNHEAAYRVLSKLNGYKICKLGEYLVLPEYRILIYNAYDLTANKEELLNLVLKYNIKYVVSHYPLDYIHISGTSTLLGIYDVPIPLFFVHGHIHEEVENPPGPNWRYFGEWYFTRHRYVYNKSTILNSALEPIKINV